MAILDNRSSHSNPDDSDILFISDKLDTTDGASGTDKKITWANVKAALLSYFNTVYQPLNAVLTNTTASFTTALQAKLDFISVTQAVDLDQMEADIAALANGMVYAGNWDASASSFPGGGTAQIGAFYTVSVGGTVDGQEFVAGDRLVATVDNASTTTFAGNWSKLDATDAVQSVAGLVGTITDAALRAALNVADGAEVNPDVVGQAEAEAGTATTERIWTAQRVAQAIAAQAASATIAIPSTDHSASGPTTNDFNAGETVAAFEVVSMKADGEWHQADADETGTVDRAMVAITLEAGTDGNPLNVALPGSIVRDDSWSWTVGGSNAAIFVNTTAGALTQTAPSATDDEVRQIGVAVASNAIYIFPTVAIVHA